MILNIPYALPPWLLVSTLLSGCVQPQKNVQRGPTMPTPSVMLNSHLQPVRPDLFTTPPEVVRYDRYLLVSISPMAAQRAPLEQIIDIRIPASLSPSVGRLFLA